MIAIKKSKLLKSHNRVIQSIDDFATQMVESLSNLSVSIASQINKAIKAKVILINDASEKIKTKISRELDACVDENFNDLHKERNSNLSDAKMEMPLVFILSHTLILIFKCLH